MNSQTAAYDAGTVHIRANCVPSRKRHATDSEFERREELPNLHFRSAFDLGAAIEYATDFWQRSLLFLDILRQSGNQQAEMTSRPINAVLIYDYEIHPARHKPAATGELCPGARGAAAGHGHRPYQAAGGRDRPACRPGAGHRGLQAGKRDWSSLQGETSRLLHRLQCRAGGGSNDRGCRARVYRVPREGDRTAASSHRETVCLWELPGRLACDHGRLHASGSFRAHRVGRRPLVLLGRRPRQEPDAVQRWPARRNLDRAPHGRPGRRHLRRRLVHHELRQPQPRQYALDEAVQRLGRAGKGEGPLPAVREVVGRLHTASAAKSWTTWSTISLSATSSRRRRS